MKNNFLLLSIIALFFSACIGGKDLKKSSLKKIKTEIINNPHFQKHFVGFYLLDPNSNQALVNINGNQAFTPASNTKILTLLTALEIFQDSFPVLKYEIIGQDSLAFHGTAYPLTLLKKNGNDSTIIDFLQSNNSKLFYCDQQFQSEKFGSGWAWDDAPYTYQRTLSPLPLYAQLVNVKHHKGYTIYTPSLLDSQFVITKAEKNLSQWKNGQFSLQLNNDKFEKSFPFEYNYNLTKDLLSNLIKKKIYSCPTDISSNFSQTISTKNNDSLYIQLLHQSDNFIAEQLLLMCSNSIFDTMNTRKIIKYSKKNILNLGDKKIRWVDGSGLSRYNLMSPQILTKLLHQVYKKIGLKQIKKLFPAGGESGTIKEWYKGKNLPYIYAKTGSLGNIHNISGYLITKKKKLLLFSFMHNHYFGPSKIIKKEMEKILFSIYEQN